MRRTLRVVLIVLVAVVAAPFGTFAFYDVSQFQMNRGRISSLIDGAAVEDRSPPEQMAALVRMDLKRTEPYSARLLMRELAVRDKPWALEYSLWCVFVQLHLSEAERLTVIMALAPTGDGRVGVTATAQSMFGRPPSQLSLEEEATIVALM